jgi:hypothetical protein
MMLWLGRSLMGLHRNFKWQVALHCKAIPRNTLRRIVAGRTAVLEAFLT